MYYTVNQILYPLVQGCETKDLKIIKVSPRLKFMVFPTEILFNLQFCLGMMQRLITQQVVDQKGALYITNALWTLMENNIEEVKVLQTVTLLLTTNTVVHGDTLAKALVLCFRLHYTKNPTIVNTAGATIRQLVSLVFERVYLEKDSVQSLQQQQQQPQASASSAESAESQDVQTFASDAFLLFQDLVQLVNAEQPYWLVGMTEMTRTFGLELLEAVLTNFSAVFHEVSNYLDLKIYFSSLKFLPRATTSACCSRSGSAPWSSSSSRRMLSTASCRRLPAMAMPPCRPRSPTSRSACGCCDWWPFSYRSTTPSW